MGDFYMTLPSNSSTDIYPNNSPAGFHTKLPRTYYLNDYEVGLAEIQLPSAHASIKDDELFFYYQHDYETHFSPYKLPSGLYDSPTAVVDYMNSKMRNKIKRNKKKTYDKRTQRTKLFVY